MVSLCDDGSIDYILTAPNNLTNVVWYAMDGQQAGTGNTLVVTSKTPGLEDGSEAYYYKGVDGSKTGCDIELCCPVQFVTRYCCPVPNCLSISVIKK